MLNAYATCPYPANNDSEVTCPDQSSDAQFDSMWADAQGGTMPYGASAAPCNAMTGELAASEPCEDAPGGASLCNSPFNPGVTGGMSETGAGPTLTGDVEDDAGTLEDMVDQGAPASLVANFANQVAQEAQGAGNNAYQSWAEGIATDAADGGTSIAAARRDFEALPSSGTDMTNGKSSSADDNYASKDATAYQKFESDVQNNNKKGVVGDLEGAIKNGDLSKADASTLISETGMNFHAGVAKGSETGTSSGADLIYNQDYHGQHVGEGIAFDPSGDRGSANFSS